MPADAVTSESTNAILLDWAYSAFRLVEQLGS